MHIILKIPPGNIYTYVHYALWCLIQQLFYINNQTCERREGKVSYPSIFPNMKVWLELFLVFYPHFKHVLLKNKCISALYLYGTNIFIYHHGNVKNEGKGAFSVLSIDIPQWGSIIFYQSMASGSDEIF